MSDQQLSRFQVQRWVSEAHSPLFTPVVRPKAVGCWSKESAAKGGGYFYGSLHGLSFYKPPSNLPESLKTGYNTYIRKDDGECTPIEVVIRGIKQSDADLSKARVCSFRNNLNKLLNTPMNLNDEWTIDACYYGTTLFLDIVKTPQRQFPNSDLFTFYGYKFEAICAGEAVVDATSEFALLVQLQLGPHGILMAAEVDCARSSITTDEASTATLPTSTQIFMELKTAKLQDNPVDRKRNLAQKYPRWWVQSFLAGIPTIVVGGRDDSGMLREVFEVPVEKLPSMAAEGGQKFDAWLLLQFGDTVLSWMTQHGQANPQQHLRFHYSPATRDIVCSVVPDGSLPHRLGQELR